jgi:hypothetical protein
LLAVLVVGIAIFWHHSNNAANADVETQTLTVSAKPVLSNNSTGEKITHSETTQTPAIPNDRLTQMGITPDMTQSQREEKYVQWYAAESAKIAAQHQHLIEFYGLTVDESNQPVAGVNAHLILTESPATPNGIVETNTQSDAQGFFSFSGAVGKLLQVWLDKNGYYVSKSNRIDFDYMGYQPNPNQPEVFHLRKKGAGADLITARYGVYWDLGVSAPLDGTPVWVDFFNRKVGETGQLEISQTKPPYSAWKTATQWTYKMEIPDGGLVEENDEFPFEAPEGGYQSIVGFDFQQGQNWATNLKKDYYIKFGNPPRYGRIHVETSIMSGTSLQYAINPDGSRYLEPKDQTYVRPQ